MYFCPFFLASLHFALSKKPLVICCIDINNCLSSLEFVAFSIIKCFSSPFLMLLGLHLILSNIKLSILDFLVLAFPWYVFVQPLIFRLYESLCYRIGFCPLDQSGSPFSNGCFMFINIYWYNNYATLFYVLLCTFCCIYCFHSLRDLFSLLHFIGVFLIIRKVSIFILVVTNYYHVIQCSQP